MPTISLTIEGMHCGACVRRVKGALEKVPGVVVGEVAIGRAEVEVASAEDATMHEALARAVEAAGFQPRPTARG